MNLQDQTTVAVDDERSPSIAVVELVAEETDTDPVDLDPLYNAVDPDVVDSLCTGNSGFRSLEFEYAGHTVVVERTGEEVEISLEAVTIGTDDSTGIADGEPSA